VAVGHGDKPGDRVHDSAASLDRGGQDVTGRISRNSDDRPVVGLPVSWTAAAAVMLGAPDPGFQRDDGTAGSSIAANRRTAAGRSASDVRVVEPGAGRDVEPIEFSDVHGGVASTGAAAPPARGAVPEQTDGPDMPGSAEAFPCLVDVRENSRSGADQ